MTAQEFNGNIKVSLRDDRIIECCARDHVRLADVIKAQAEIERLRGTAGTIGLLYDGTMIESFEPGIPIRWVRWSALHPEHTGRVAIVGRTGPMTALAKTFQFLMPTRRIAIFTHRAAAIAYLKSASG